MHTCNEDNDADVTHVHANSKLIKAIPKSYTY
jgi:hypothetical protein